MLKQRAVSKMPVNLSTPRWQSFSRARSFPSPRKCSTSLLTGSKSKEWDCNSRNLLKLPKVKKTTRKLRRIDFALWWLRNAIHMRLEVAWRLFGLLMAMPWLQSCLPNHFISSFGRERWVPLRFKYRRSCSLSLMEARPWTQKLSSLNSMSSWIWRCKMLVSMQT